MMQNGRLPVLDLELFIVNNKVQFSFFKKPVSSPFTIMYASALPANQKRNSLFQECLRRLRNCAPSISWEDKAKMLSDYINSLRWYGDSHKYRARLMEGVSKRQRR